MSTACPTPGCPGPGPDWADRGPDPEDSIPIPCTTCGVHPEGVDEEGSL